jgi:hypothetical protein
VARALALFGMAATHIYPGFQPDGDLHWSHAVASGRASALFALLAGVGLALSTGGTDPLTGRDLGAARGGVLTRAVLLTLIGLLLGSVESPPLVILAYYGLLFLVAVPFLGLSARVLAVLAVAAALVTPLVSHLLRKQIDPTPIAEPGGPDLLVELFLTGTYPVLTWTTYLFAGMAVGRLPLRRLSVAAKVLVVGLAVAVTARVLSAMLLDAVGGPERLAESAPDGSVTTVENSLAAGMFGTTPTGDWRWLTVAAPHSGTTFDLVHTTGSALAVLGACLLLARLLPQPLLLPLAAAGSMTLTLYTLHVLAVADGSPFLVKDPQQLWISHVLVALAIATLWRTTIGRGPLEALAAWLDRTARKALAPGGKARSVR